MTFHRGSLLIAFALASCSKAEVQCPRPFKASANELLARSVARLPAADQAILRRSQRMRDGSLSCCEVLSRHSKPSTSDYRYISNAAYAVRMYWRSASNNQKIWVDLYDDCGRYIQGDNN